MTPEQFELVAEVFEQARQKDASERQVYLDSACGGDTAIRAEVESLLAHHDHGPETQTSVGIAGPLHGSPESGLSVRRTIASVPSALPSRIGSYEIIRKLGEGGMGTVFLARQDHPRREVALKLIRPVLATPNMLRRFELEAHVLGQLQHPGIARIYDAGTDEASHGSQPYFAMEYIDGQRLNDYVRDRRLGMRERLELFAVICDAVHHAHQKGVVHRDLKPANILVEPDGQPKILDFGVARVTDADVHTTTLHTDPGQLVGTLPYMSPEQVSGGVADVDIRSDVYALGVILYEVLAGRPPYDLRNRSIVDAARVIQTQEPMNLRSVHTSLRGDVETIVAKALEKDKERRYASAAELASDIRRHLTDQPIGARPPSAVYQLRKFARRNKPIVAGVGIAFAALIALLVGVTVSLVKTRSAERLAAARLVAAETARQEAEAVNRFLERMLTNANPAKTQGEQMTLLSLLDQASEQIDDFAAGTPEVEAGIRTTIGRTYQMIGQYDAATGHFRRALTIYRAAASPYDENFINAEIDLAANLELRYEIEAAEALALESIERIRTLGERGKDMLARQQYTLGAIRKEQGEYQAAIDIFRESIENFGDDVESRGPRARAMSELGACLTRLGRHEEAEAWLRKGLALTREVHGEGGPHEAGTLNTLAVLIKRQGRLDQAEALYREAMRIQRALHGDLHPQTGATIGNLGRLMSQRGDHVEAERLLQEAVDIKVAVHGDQAVETAVARGMLASTLISLGKPEEAEAQARQSLAVFEATLGADHEYCATSLVSVADALSKQGDFAAALPCIERAVAIYRARLGDRHPYVVSTLVSLGEVQQKAGALDAADASFAEACAAAEARGKGGQGNLEDVLTSWAMLAMEQGKAALAEQRCRRAMDVSAALPSHNARVRGKQVRLLADIHVDRGEFDAAESLLRSFRDELVAAKPVRTDLIAKCDGWLANVDAKRAERNATSGAP